MPREKYLLPPATGPVLRFTDLNLELAVVDELMYRQQEHTPTFSLAEFARWYDARTTDLEREAGRPVPEVLDYFAGLPIEQALADRVRELVVDAGNEIYQQVAPWWDGEDATFDIGSWDDLALLPALERLAFVSLTPTRPPSSRCGSGGCGSTPEPPSAGVPEGLHVAEVEPAGQ
ncbi:hypothetical protein DT076_10560 [Desertihabitans brevis]|uniref:DUF6892 domain-containing protein n=1 Tax=Desertihabitans brevis TaxID=2268447 RepID=A0A367YWE6_9ACTN|nr:hypothetical protein DT076_10560 [Desertihabitans brevis]